MQVFDCKGQFLSTFSKKGAASKRLQKLSFGICVGSDQLVYVCDNGTIVCQCLRQVESL